MDERRFELDGDEWIATVESGRKGARVSGFRILFRRTDGGREVTGSVTAADISHVTEADLKMALKRALFAAGFG